MEALKRTQIAFLSKGKEKEKEFMSLFLNAAESTKEEDIHGHIDLKVYASVDVKSMKKLSRDDDSPNENFHWIEIKNVQDKPGWLYGEADYFAFETIDYWVIVDKQDLQDLIKKKVTKEFVSDKKNSLYKLYRRDGRKDIITLVKTLDLMKIATKTFDKN